MMKKLFQYVETYTILIYYSYEALQLLLVLTRHKTGKLRMEIPDEIFKSC